MTCWMCHRDIAPESGWVLLALSDGRVVRLCEVCDERTERNEPAEETVDYTEGVEA